MSRQLGNVFVGSPSQRASQTFLFPNWRGLRDSFRTLDWREILNDWGTDTKKLDYFLAKAISS
jgi:hypothetical protein